MRTSLMAAIGSTLLMAEGSGGGPARTSPAGQAPGSRERRLWRRDRRHPGRPHERCARP